jgi:dTDP-4-amino-4,6-dideoxygalactose transaminase
MSYAGAAAVASGTAALQLALLALGCKEDDEVILPTYVCREILEAVTSLRAKPVLCDSGPHWNIEASEVQSVLTPRTKIIIAPHLYGIFLNTASLRRFGIPIIEDFAQAFPPAKRPIRPSGDIAIFSFHPTKCLTTGEGGMCASNDAELLSRLNAIRGGSSNGLTQKVFSPLSDIAATLGLSQLRRYDSFIAKRELIASRYADALKANKNVNFDWYANLESMFFRFPIHLRGGLEMVRESFATRGIVVRRGVDELLHRKLGFSDSQFPNAVRHFESTVSLPIYPSMDPATIEHCVESAIKVFDELKRGPL